MPGPRGFCWMVSNGPRSRVTVFAELSFGSGLNVPVREEHGTLPLVGACFFRRSDSFASFVPVHVVSSSFVLKGRESRWSSMVSFSVDVWATRGRGSGRCHLLTRHAELRDWCPSYACHWNGVFFLVNTGHQCVCHPRLVTPIQMVSSARIDSGSDKEHKGADPITVQPFFFQYRLRE